MTNKLRLSLSCLLLLLAVSIQAFNRNLKTYYQDADGKKAAELKTALYGIIGNPSVKSYGSLWDFYYDTDRQLSDNLVIDRYSNEKRYFSVKGSQPSGMNKEHGIPQSWWGGGTSGIGSDLQHVVPSDTEANSRKSNYGMGIVTTQTWTNGSIKVGKGKGGNNETIQMWEPADNWKGDFARAYFYIVTAYEERSLVQKEGANSMQNNTYPKLQPWAYELYIKWSREDPVDDLERRRNNIVDSIQGNRNPFIDFPGLERYIWGDLKNEAVDLANYSNPEGGETQTDATAFFSIEQKSILVGETFQQQVETESDGIVTYESSNTEVATVDQASGLVTANAVGRAVITANVGATDMYRATSASYTIIVTEEGVAPGPAEGDTYTKITERPVSWAGTYLIVYDAEDLALNGQLTEYDVANNFVAVTILQDVIDVTSETEAAEFVVAPMTDGKYSIRGSSGKYIGQLTSKNSIATSDTPIPNSLNVNNGEASIVSNQSFALRFNAQNGQKRFRFYQSGQESISLYRRTELDTGIETTYNSQTEHNRMIYDLSGRRIKGHLNPGLYIIDGKKTFVK